MVSGPGLAEALLVPLPVKIPHVAHVQSIGRGDWVLVGLESVEQSQSPHLHSPQGPEHFFF